MYAAIKDKSATLDALQKAITADPQQVLPYKMLAFNYMSDGSQDNAIATWQKLRAVAPDDPDSALYLGALYVEQKHYRRRRHFLSRQSGQILPTPMRK
jgi:Tfp pilus assembly protein PilF